MLQIVNIMAASLDGLIGAHALEGDTERQSIGLSSPADAAFLREMIATCDAIVVGSSSIRASGACIDVNGRHGKPPLWLLLSRSSLAVDLPFWQQHHIPRAIVSPTPLACPSTYTGINLPYGAKELTGFVTDYLIEQGFQKVLLFGGGQINRYFYNANLVDELYLTVAPLLIGQPQAPKLMEPPLDRHVEFQLQDCRRCDSHLFLHYTVKKHHLPFFEQGKSEE